MNAMVLKLIALATMFVDHLFASNINPGWIDLTGTAGQRFLTTNWNIYYIGRIIGRIAFPIFCFLIVEGFEHTHNRIHYGANLLLFCIISEIPWNIGMGRDLHYARQNVYYTLFFGFLTMCLIEYFEGKRLIQTFIMAVMVFFTAWFSADYSYRGYILLMIMYWLRKQRAAQALIACAWLKYEWTASFAFIFINMYNGKRGFIKSGVLKYAFYLFYPVHILCLILIREILFNTPVKF